MKHNPEQILKYTVNNSNNILHTKNGYYYGTEKGGVWWKRYWKEGWLARGNSEIWVNAEGIFFRRYMTKNVLHIPIQDIIGITRGSCHSGRWSGAPVLKVAWEKDGTELVSGLTVSWSNEETEKWITTINKLLTIET